MPLFYPCALVASVIPVGFAFAILSQTRPDSISTLRQRRKPVRNSVHRCDVVASSPGIRFDFATTSQACPGSGLTLRQHRKVARKSVRDCDNDVSTPQNHLASI
jgi:hypothetical protein